MLVVCENIVFQQSLLQFIAASDSLEASSERTSVQTEVRSEMISESEESGDEEIDEDEYAVDDEQHRFALCFPQ